MDLFEIFMYGLFFIVLYWAFADEFVSSSNQLELTEGFDSNLEQEQQQKQDRRTCGLKQGLVYPLDPAAYYGYWGFRPYKGLWKHINPWWYYPYPYPTPINYQTDSCVSKLQ
jgi:hypothetical protein